MKTPAFRESLREMSMTEIDKKLADLKQELFNLRFQHAINQLENPMRLKAVKKDIARVMTIRTERLTKEAGSAAEEV